MRPTRWSPPPAHPPVRHLGSGKYTSALHTIHSLTAACWMMPYSMQHTLSATNSWQVGLRAQGQGTRHGGQPEAAIGTCLLQATRQHAGQKLPAQQLPPKATHSAMHIWDPGAGAGASSGAVDIGRGRQISTLNGIGRCMLGWLAQLEA